MARMAHKGRNCDAPMKTLRQAILLVGLASIPLSAGAINRSARVTRPLKVLPALTAIRRSQFQHPEGADET